MINVDCKEFKKNNKKNIDFKEWYVKQTIHSELRKTLAENNGLGAVCWFIMPD